MEYYLSSVQNEVLQEKHKVTQTDFSPSIGGKMYRLGGETDSAIRRRKRTGVMSARGTEQAGC